MNSRPIQQGAQPTPSAPVSFDVNHIGIFCMDNAHLNKLNLLGTFHYVVGGIGVFFACFPLIHFGLGIGGAYGGDAHGGGGECSDGSADIWVFICLYWGAVFLFGQTMAWLTIYSGKLLKKQQKHTSHLLSPASSASFFPSAPFWGFYHYRASR